MLELKAGETVLFPAPYEEDKVVPLIVTTMRVVQMTGDKRQELDARKITFLARQSLRPFIFLGIFFVLTGLPLLGYGGYLYYTVNGMPSFSEQPPSVDLPAFDDPGMVRWEALAFGVGAALFLGAAFLCVKKQRHLVICRADKRVMKLKVKTKTEQTQVLMTLQATLQTAKLLAAQPVNPQPTGPPPAPKKTRIA